jgi:hypothetical protein
MAGTNSINLLRSSENHFWEQFLKWALTTGRFLIILTETIALSAFVYRFSLDREIIDLGDKIKQNQTIVSYYKRDELRYRNLHERLAFAEQMTAPVDEKTALLESFVEIARGKVTFQEISVNANAVTVEISTTSTGALSSFLAGIQNLDRVKSVNVNRVENKTANGRINVTITADLIQPGGTNEHN